jgi:hypothetical protein
MHGAGTGFNLAIMPSAVGNKKMPDMTLGLILGCALAEFKYSKGKKSEEAGRLFRILVSESAYLI